MDPDIAICLTFVRSPPGLVIVFSFEGLVRLRILCCWTAAAHLARTIDDFDLHTHSASR